MQPVFSDVDAGDAAAADSVIVDDANDAIRCHLRWVLLRPMQIGLMPCAAVWREIVAAVSGTKRAAVGALNDDVVVMVSMICRAIRTMHYDFWASIATLADDVGVRRVQFVVHH